MASRSCGEPGRLVERLGRTTGNAGANGLQSCLEFFQRAAGSGQPAQDLDDSVEKEQTRLVRRQLRAFWEGTQTCLQLRSELGDRGCVVAQEFTQVIVVTLFPNPATESLDERKNMEFELERILSGIYHRVNHDPFGIIFVYENN